MKTTLLTTLSIVILLITYTIVGTGSRVPEIERRAPAELEKMGFRILRCDGYQWNSWSKHGGVVWYHVAEKENPAIRYRIQCVLWAGKLQLYYGNAERVENLQLSSE